MSYHIDIQHASEDKPPISDAILRHWAKIALKSYKHSAELTLRLVNEEEMIQLNHDYRKQNKPTNVLAFPANYPPQIALKCPLLGDVIICPSVLNDESRILNKRLNSHWAHIVIHGVLHLLGYDHINEDDTKIMQAIEVRLLAQLGFDNPYESEAN